MDKHDGGDPGALRVDDPWYDALAAGLWVPDPTAPAPPPVPAPAAAGTAGADRDRTAIYLEVQRSAAFQEVRGQYRRFAFPAVAAFLGWYLLYVVAATVAPGLMSRPVAGELNVAMVAGLGQFATTFLLTWAYSRHARLRRDRAALDLRWDTQERMR
ncbi:DUF485 domain-containing protein [Streptomyces sp. NPDC006733]|uniref:DUF485 domain-containing protein n=1 Tax=Streptomyces sp. NPDC006733 TaxID=3155460 RepID=UPI0033E768A3